MGAIAFVLLTATKVVDAIPGSASASASPGVRESLASDCVVNEIGEFSEYTIPEIISAKTAAPKAPANAGRASTNAVNFCKNTD